MKEIPYKEIYWHDPHINNVNVTKSYNLHGRRKDIWQSSSIYVINVDEEIGIEENPTEYSPQYEMDLTGLHDTDDYVDIDDDME